MNSLRPILRKKKSVTFTPDTKLSSSAANSPVVDSGHWSAVAAATAATGTRSSSQSNGSKAAAPLSPSKRRRSPRNSSRSPSPSPALATTSSAPPAVTPPLPPKPYNTATRLLDYSHLPAWQQDNPLILSSYRPASHTHLSSLPSLFTLHNETCNIWFHLAGLAFFSIYGLIFLARLSTTHPSSTDGDRAAFTAFFGGTCTCLAASAAYHLFSNVGPAEARIWNGVDYAGIVACIWGSFVGCLHFGLPDDAGVSDAEGKAYVRFGTDGRETDVGKERRRGYEMMITALALVCTTISITPRFRTPAWRPFRAIMFVLMGTSATVPVLHGINLYGWEQLQKQMGLSWVVLQGLLYVTGAGLYAARVPERLAPGKFDVCGSSHQIFHVLVVLAAGSHLIGMTKALNYACSIR